MTTLEILLLICGALALTDALASCWTLFWQAHVFQLRRAPLRFWWALLVGVLFMAGNAGAGSYVLFMLLNR